MFLVAVSKDLAYSKPDHNFVGSGRQAKVPASCCVQFHACRNIQFSDGDSSRPRADAPVIRTRVQRIVLDHISLDFFLVSITKDEHGRRFARHRAREQKVLMAFNLWYAKIPSGRFQRRCNIVTF
jgi:hypothetical protein